jgi:hypothetical protein
MKYIKYFIGFLSSPSRDVETSGETLGGKELEKNSIQPLTIKMCLNAKKELPISPFSIDTIEINNVFFLSHFTNL